MESKDAALYIRCIYIAYSLFASCFVRYPKERPNHQRFFGADMGLVLTLKTTPSDYFFRKHQQSGFEVTYANTANVLICSSSLDHHLRAWQLS